MTSSLLILILTLFSLLALSLPTPPYTLSPLGWSYLPTANTTSSSHSSSLAPRSPLSSRHITLNDYPSLSAITLNPPYCGFAYNYPLLDLTRVTAMEAATQSDCGSCLRVCGAAGCREVLVIDRGGRGLDLTTGARDAVLGAGQDGVVGGRDVGGWEEEEVREETAEEEVVASVETVASTPEPSSISTAAAGSTDTIDSPSVTAGSSSWTPKTSAAPASTAADPIDEAAFLSALAGTSETLTSDFFDPPSVTDEEGFLSALTGETQSRGPTTPASSPGPVTATAKSPSYATPGTFSTLSSTPGLATAIPQPSVSPTSSRASAAVSTALRTNSTTPPATGIVIPPTEPSPPPSTSAVSAPPVYTLSSNSSATEAFCTPSSAAAPLAGRLPPCNGGTGKRWWDCYGIL
ncbi:Mucin-2 [Xylographa carneopallida]|nr:Mucin-2 [Xylographa carneopallida]